MALEVELSGQLLPGTDRRLTLLLDRAMTVREVVDRLGMDPEEIGLIVVNGIQSELDDLVPLDGRVCFYPPMTGG
ncbi:MAG: hypothetical protein A2Y61_07170 [Chloroflexi bacterium RBG_13_60_13]|nr:MAG: hypothetical protein A2Y61_07170 [Chloroflexi bacterium RBG_13_60_13]